MKDFESKTTFYNAQTFITQDDWKEIMPNLADKREFDALKARLSKVSRNMNKIDDFDNLEREMKSSMYSLSEKVDMATRHEDFEELKEEVQTKASIRRMAHLEALLEEDY